MRRETRRGGEDAYVLLCTTVQRPFGRAPNSSIPTYVRINAVVHYVVLARNARAASRGGSRQAAVSNETSCIMSSFSPIGWGLRKVLFLGFPRNTDMMITTKKSATNNSSSNSSSSSASSNNNDTTTTSSSTRRNHQQQQQHQQNSPTLTTRRRGGGVRTSNGLLWTKTNTISTNPDTTKLQQYPTKKCPWYNLLFPILVLLLSCSWILFVLFVLIYHHHHHDTATTSIINNYNPSHSTTTARKNSAASRDFHKKIISSSSITNTAKTQLRTSTASTSSSSSSTSSSRSKVTAKMTQTIRTTSSTLAPNWQPRNDYTNNRNNNNNNTSARTTNTLLQLEEAKKIPLTPLRHPIDYEKYTIRMNTWKRNEQLLLSLNHHASCQGVAQIQVVWCNSEEDPPPSILYHPSGKVVVERHTVNSLNERFHILPTTNTPTIGILSLDDDVLRPCQAWDSGKFQK